MLPNQSIVPESSELAQFMQQFRLNEPGDHYNYAIVSQDNQIKYLGITSELYARMTNHRYVDRKKDTIVILTVMLFTKK